MRPAPAARARGPRVLVADLQRRKVDRRAVAAAARSALVAEGHPAVELSVTLVDDERIGELHAEYLGDPTPTDVISFPFDEDDDELEACGRPRLLGEVVVSTDTAAREAKARGLTFERELLLYVIHGTLHLLGWDDRRVRDRKRMHARQDELLEAFLAARALKRPRAARRPRARAGPV